MDDINLDLKKLSKEEICKSLNIIDGPKEYVKPKNIGLLMFCKDLKKFIKTPWIETTIFFDEAGDKFEEKIFEGSIVDQINNSLDYIKTKVIAERVRKINGQAESLRYFNYPYEAIEEAVVNAVYHKNYDEDAPIEVRVELDRIDIISYPGPIPPLSKDNINDKTVISKKYRNRRIGEFLKEYKLTEGKNTGFRKIRSSLKYNGSPEPEFITDADRVQFITRIRIHPDFENDSANINVLENVGLKHPLKHPLKELFELIQKNPGINRDQISELMSRSINTLKDQIKKLIELDLIERRGSKKTGGYFTK